MSLDSQLIVDHDIALVAPFTTFSIAQEVVTERGSQDAKWGQQNHSDGTGRLVAPLYSPDRFVDDDMAASTLADIFKARTDTRFSGKGDRPGTWADILLEEVFEALAEHEPAKLRTELIQVAAVASAWVEAIDRRQREAADLVWDISKHGASA